jgi:hypothetical protein
MMMIETVRYTMREGGAWQSVALTPGEIQILADYLNQIQPPVSGGTLKFPHTFTFFPQIYFHAIEFPDQTWDARNGWRD